MAVLLLGVSAGHTCREYASVQDHPSSNTPLGLRSYGWVVVVLYAFITQNIPYSVVGILFTRGVIARDYTFVPWQLTRPNGSLTGLRFLHPLRSMRDRIQKCFRTSWRMASSSIQLTSNGKMSRYRSSASIAGRCTR